MKINSYTRLILFLAFIAVMLSSCSEPADRLWLKSPGWSRAQLIGQTSLDQPISLALDGAGQIYFLTTRLVGRTHYLHLIKLDHQGEVTWERDIGTGLIDFDGARLSWDRDELVVIWLDDNSLYTSWIDPLGESQSEPLLQSQGIKVTSFDVAVGPSQPVVWFGGNWQQPGVYMLSVNKLPGEPVLVNAEGFYPTARYDHQGTLYASWISYPEGPRKPQIYFVGYPGGVYQPDQETLVAELSIRSDSLLDGPYLGFDSTQVYLFWNEVIRSGRRMNQGNPMYIHFRATDPTVVSEPVPVLVPNTDKLVYEPLPGVNTESVERVNLDSGRYSLISPDKIVVDPSNGSEITIALNVRIPDPQDNMVAQVGTLYLRDGQSAGYQLLSYTPKEAHSTALIRDPLGYHYLTWLERTQSGGYSVYFASTAPDLQQAFSTVTSGDLSRMITDTTFGLLKGAIFSFIYAPIWLALPALLLVVTRRFREEAQNLPNWIPLVTLVLAVILYWAGKLFTLGSLNSYIPFTVWIPVIPSWLDLALQFGVPIIATMIALLVAWRYTRRNVASSALLFLAIYGGMDCIFTLAVYGELLFSRF